MKVVNTFKPIISSDCEILILGTLPSEQSREKGEYYFNKTNRFWKMICEYLGVDVPDNYENKVKLLLDNKIGLWDIIKTCDIDNSKNSTITGPTFNDIETLLKTYPNIKLILFNGKDSYGMYKQYLNDINIPILSIPNTSNVNVHFKQEIWEKALSLLTIQGNNYSENSFLNRDMYKKCFLHYMKLCNSRPYKFDKNSKEYKFNECSLTRTSVETGIPSNTIKLVLEEAISLKLI